MAGAPLAAYLTDTWSGISHQVRQIALQHLVSFTGSSDGREQLKPTPVVPNLCRLLGDLRVLLIQL